MYYSTLQMADEWNENETLGKSFRREDFEKLKDDQQVDGDKDASGSGTKGANSESDTQVVKGGKSPKSKGIGADQRHSNDNHRQNNNRPSYRNDVGRSDSSETSKDSSTKKQYNNGPRNERDMHNRHDTRNSNQQHHRNFDKDGSNRNFNREGANRNHDRDASHRNHDRDGASRNHDKDGPNRNHDRDGPNRNHNKDVQNRNQGDGGNRNHDRDGPNRNHDRDGKNRNQDREGPNRSFDSDGPKRNYNSNQQNRRRDDASDSDKNYMGGYERYSEGRRSGRNQNDNSNRSRDDGHSQHQQGRGGSGNQNSHTANKNEPKERNYIPPTPTEDEDELFASGITSGVNFLKFDEIPVNVSGEDIPPIIDSFENSGLSDFVVQNIKRSGYTHPTPIQKNAIPIILAGRDIMACAQTGSGKTAAFLLPIISTLLSDEKPLSNNKPHVLVVSPTRELGIQIEMECRKFAMKSYLKSLLVYGGTAIGYQMDKANNGCHLLIATPGRLLDFITRGIVSFEDLRFLVLDEADRMLDMGFLPDIEKLMEHSSMPPPDKRKTLMFSATFPEQIQRLAGKFLNNYLFVAVGIVGGACADVEQCIYEVTKFHKRKQLLEIIEKDDPDGIMVFVETKRNADFLATFLSEKFALTTSMHGDRYQSQREAALREFKSGKMKLMIATSVAARGLDIKNVRHVINFDMPKSIDEYVHRIGRTGRVGNCGKATSFFDPEEDYAIAADLKKILHQAGQKVPDFLIDVDVSSSKQNANNRRGNFGGKDVRKGQYHRKFENKEHNDDRTVRPDEPVEHW